jgi:hypothetical protein
MNFLEPDTDRAVRAAVDAFLDGRLRPAVNGDAVFETKNSRYRMRDGRISAATDGKLIGAELVGWLQEMPDGQVRVSAWWAPLSRAVLLDRRFGRHIVVTSATLMMEVNGVLLEGSDTRPAPPPLKQSQPPTADPAVPAAVAQVQIPRPAGVPRWSEIPVSEAPESANPTSQPPPSIPITPSTPPPRSVPAPGATQQTTRPLGPPNTRGRSSLG